MRTKSWEMLISVPCQEPVLLLALIAVAMELAAASHFRGAIIQWRPVDPDNFDGRVLFTHRVAWANQGNCNAGTVSTGNLIGSGTLTCRSGCSGDIGSLQYPCTDFSVAENWMAGQDINVRNLHSVANFEASFTGNAWISTVQGSSNWEVRVKGNLSPRPDNGRINSSPTTAVSPVYRLRHGATHTITIPVHDADGDIVRCRWASSAQSECGGVCRAFSATLNQENCRLTYNAYGSTGYYAVALQVEDFISSSSTVAMSSVPVQFLVLVEQISIPYGVTAPTFVGTTPADGSFITVGSTYQQLITARSGGSSAFIADISTVSPLGLLRSGLTNGSSSQESYITVTWTPTASQQGANIFCYTATDNYRFTSQQSCITLVVGESANINVTRNDSLVLECQGRSVSWNNFSGVGNSTILYTKANADGIQTSWLVYDNVTKSESYISCHRSGQYTKYYNIKVYAPPSNVTITDSGLTANTVRLNYPTTLTCSASGTSPLQYQWYKATNSWSSRYPLSGANSTNYAVTVTSAQMSDAGIYTCEVSNWAGKDEGMYTLRVQESPSNVHISASNTRSNTVRLGYSTTLYCSVSRGTSPLQYKWYRNGIIIPGETYNRYTIYNTQFSNAGRYTCEVSNWVGRSSGSYFLGVQAYPSNVQISDTGLISRTVALEASAILSCSSSATSPSYQWYHNGIYISGARSQWYTVSSANFSDAGQYMCEVSNIVGTGRGTYELRVQAIPSNVIINNSALTLNTVRLGIQTTFTCSASGTGPLRYQWYHNASRIYWATSANYRAPSTSYSSAGVYTCVVSNWAGEDNGTYTLKVQAPPSAVRITDSGLNSRAIGLRGYVTLYCSSSGTSPSYKWYHNGSYISGTYQYTISYAQFRSAGLYRCEVSNIVGMDSGTYQLRVQAQPTITVMNTSALNNEIIAYRTRSTSVTISCTAIGDVSSVAFQWTLNGGYVPSSRTSAINSGEHVIGRLHISPVRPTHGGTYRCSTSNLVGSDRQYLTLRVVDPPIVNAIRVNGSGVGGVVYALNGTMSNFGCATSGTHPLSTSWILQTTKGVETRASSTFNSILMQDDEGNYTCVVNNFGDGLNDSATVVVKVFDPISLTSNTMLTIKHDENDQVTLRCAFFKDPDDPDPFPQVTWNGPSVNTRRPATETTQNGYESTFTFTATRNHHGRLTCSVNDVGFGVIQAVFQLTVYYPPTGITLQPTSPSVSIGSSANFTCTGHGRPPPEFTFTRRLPDGTEQRMSGATFVLQASSKEEIGNNLLTCSATNSKYLAPVPSASHSITIKGVPEVVNSETVEVTHRSFTSVSLKWNQPQDNFDTVQNYHFKLGKCETSNPNDNPCQLVRSERTHSRYPVYTLRRLSPFTTYTLEIAAHNRVGPGPYSNVVVIQTVRQDEATVRNFTALFQEDAIVLLQWHADVNLTQASTAFSYFSLTRLHQGSLEEENVTLTLNDALCPNSTTQTSFCFEWNGFAAGAVYSVWIEMVYSYPATGGRVILTVTNPKENGISVPVVAGGGGAGLFAILLLFIIVVIPIIVVVCKRKRRMRRTEKHANEEEDGTNCSNTARSNEYAKESFMLDQSRAKITPSAEVSNPYQPLDVEGLAHTSSYASYSFGPTPKSSEPETHVTKESSSKGGPKKEKKEKAGDPNSGRQPDPDYAVPSEVMAEYTAGEIIYVEPEDELAEEHAKVKETGGKASSTATSGATPPRSGKQKKKALQPPANMKETLPSTTKPQSSTQQTVTPPQKPTANKKQAPPSTPKPQNPKQQTATGSNPAANMTSTSPPQPSGFRVAETPPSLSAKPQKPKQQTAVDTNAPASVPTASPLQRSASRVSEGQDKSTQPKPKKQSLEAPAVALKRSTSSVKPPQEGKITQSDPADPAKRGSTQLSRADSKLGVAVKPKTTAVGPMPPHVAVKGIPLKPEDKGRGTTSTPLPQTTEPAVKPYPAISEGTQKAPPPPTPASGGPLLLPPDPARQLKPTPKPQSGSTPGKLSVVERAKLLEKLM